MRAPMTGAGGTSPSSPDDLIRPVPDTPEGRLAATSADRTPTSADRTDGKPYAHTGVHGAGSTSQEWCPASVTPTWCPASVIGTHDEGSRRDGRCTWCEYRFTGPAPRPRLGSGYRTELDRALPGGFATAVSRADVFFQAEMPAIGGWRFGPDDAARIAAPVLNVRGATTAPRFVEASDLVQAWFPRAEEVWLPDTGHLLMLQRPEEVAKALVAFLERSGDDR